MEQNKPRTKLFVDAFVHGQLNPPTLGLDYTVSVGVVLVPVSKPPIKKYLHR